MRFEIVNSNFATFCAETAPLQVREKNRKPENPLNNRKKVENQLNPAEEPSKQGGRILTAYYDALRKFARFCEKRGTLQIAIVTEKSPETPQSVCAAGKWGYTQLLVTILLLQFLKKYHILHFLLGLPCVDCRRYFS